MFYGLRKQLQRRIPAGIAVGPFEFATAAGYLIAGVRLETNPTARTQIERALFAGGGLTAWLAVLVASSAAVIVGQLTAAHAPAFGLHTERLGLIGISISLATYLFAVWARGNGFTVQVATVGAILAASLFKAAIINTALIGARTRRRRQRTRPQ